MGEPVREAVDLGALADGVVDGAVRQINSRAKVDTHRRGEPWTTWLRKNGSAHLTNSAASAASGWHADPEYTADARSTLQAIKSILVNMRRMLQTWPVYAAQINNLHFRWSIRLEENTRSIALVTPMHERLRQELHSATHNYFCEASGSASPETQRELFTRSLQNFANQNEMIEIFAGALGVVAPFGDLDTLIEMVVLGAASEGSRKLLSEGTDQATAFPKSRNSNRATDVVVNSIIAHEAVQQRLLSLGFSHEIAKQVVNETTRNIEATVGSSALVGNNVPNSVIYPLDSVLIEYFKAFHRLKTRYATAATELFCNRFQSRGENEIHRLVGMLQSLVRHDSNRTGAISGTAAAKLFPDPANASPQENILSEAKQASLDYVEAISAYMESDDQRRTTVRWDLEAFRSLAVHGSKLGFKYPLFDFLQLFPAVTSQNAMNHEVTTFQQIHHGQLPLSLLDQEGSFTLSRVTLSASAPPAHSSAHSRVGRASPPTPQRETQRDPDHLSVRLLTATPPQVELPKSARSQRRTVLSTRSLPDEDDSSLASTCASTSIPTKQQASTGETVMAEQDVEAVAENQVITKFQFGQLTTAADDKNTSTPAQRRSPSRPTHHQRASFPGASQQSRAPYSSEIEHVRTRLRAQIKGTVEASVNAHDNSSTSMARKSYNPRASKITKPQDSPNTLSLRRASRRASQRHALLLTARDDQMKQLARLQEARHDAARASQHQKQRLEEFSQQPQLPRYQPSPTLTPPRAPSPPALPPPRMPESPIATPQVVPKPPEQQFPESFESLDDDKSVAHAAEAISSSRSSNHDSVPITNHLPDDTTSSPPQEEPEAEAVKREQMCMLAEDELSFDLRSLKLEIAVEHDESVQLSETGPSSSQSIKSQADSEFSTPRSSPSRGALLRRRVSTLIPFLALGRKQKHPRRPDYTQYFDPMNFSEDVVFDSNQSEVFPHGAGVSELNVVQPLSAQSSEADFGYDDIDAAVETRKEEKRKAVHNLYADSRLVEDWMNIECVNQRNWPDTLARSRQLELGIQPPSNATHPPQHLSQQPDEPVQLVRRSQTTSSLMKTKQALGNMGGHPIEVTVVELPLGASLDGDTLEDAYYQTEIRETQAIVTFRSISYDVDARTELYVTVDKPPTPEDYIWRSCLDGKVQSVVLYPDDQRFVAGAYYVRVHTYSPKTRYSIACFYSESEPENEQFEKLSSMIDKLASLSTVEPEHLVNNFEAMMSSTERRQNSSEARRSHQQLQVTVPVTYGEFQVKQHDEDAKTLEDAVAAQGLARTRSTSEPVQFSARTGQRPLNTEELYHIVNGVWKRAGHREKTSQKKALNQGLRKLWTGEYPFAAETTRSIPTASSPRNESVQGCQEQHIQSTPRTPLEHAVRRHSMYHQRVASWNDKHNGLLPRIEPASSLNEQSVNGTTQPPRHNTSKSRSYRSVDGALG